MKTKTTSTTATETLPEKIAAMPPGLRPPSPLAAEAPPAASPETTPTLALESTPLVLTGNNGEKVAVSPLAETIAPAEPWVESALLALSRLVVSPTNPRKDFNEETHAELCKSMRKHGFTLSAMLVRPIQETLRIEQIENSWRLIKASPGGDIPLDVFPTEAGAQTAMLARGGRFEIVAGERRYRAATAVGITHAPCIVRTLTDQQVLELQLVESFRDNLNAIEEAAHMQILLTMLDSEGKHIHTTASLSLVIGKSVRHIEQRRQLCLLEGEARAQVVAGTLPVRTAFLIARIPDETLRAKATKAILHPTLHEAPLSYRRADELVQSEFMRDLRGAPFEQKDETLVPVELDAAGIRIFGGDCVRCPARLGNSAEPGTITPAQHNLCLSPKCFVAKCDAGWEKWRAENTDALRKRRALTKAECEACYKFGDQLANAHLVDLADRPDSNDLKPGKVETATWRKMTAGAGLEIQVARDRNGRTHDLVNRDLAIIAAEGNGHKNFKASKNGAAPATAGKGSSAASTVAAGLASEDSAAAAVEIADDPDSEGERDRRACLLLELTETRRAQALMKGAKKATDEVIREVIRAVLYVASPNIYEIADALGMPDIDGGNSDAFAWVESAIEKQTDNERIGTLVLVSLYIHSDTRRVDTMDRFRKVLAVDFKAIDKAAKVEQAANEKARMAEEELHAALAWQPYLAPGSELITDPNAKLTWSDFLWNAQNECNEPWRCVIGFPSTVKKTTAEITVAKSKKGWHVGFAFTCPTGIEEKKPSQSATSYGNRELALRCGLLEAERFFKDGGAPAATRDWIAAVLAPFPAPVEIEASPAKKPAKAKIAAEIKARWAKVRAKAAAAKKPAAKKPAKKAAKKGGK